MERDIAAAMALRISSRSSPPLASRSRGAGAAGAGDGATGDGGETAASTSRRPITPSAPGCRRASSRPSSSARRIAAGVSLAAPATGRGGRDRRRPDCSLFNWRRDPCRRRRRHSRRDARWRRRRHRHGRLRGFRRDRFPGAFGADHRKRRSNRHLLADLDQNPVEDAGLESLDLDRALLGLDRGNHFAALDLIARLLHPLDQSAGIHVRAQRWHLEFAHRRSTCLQAATMDSGCGVAASSRWRG